MLCSRLATWYRYDCRYVNISYLIQYLSSHIRQSVTSLSRVLSCQQWLWGTPCRRICSYGSDVFWFVWRPKLQTIVWTPIGCSCASHSGIQIVRPWSAAHSSIGVGSDEHSSSYSSNSLDPLWETKIFVLWFLRLQSSWSSFDMYLKKALWRSSVLDTVLLNVSLKRLVSPLCDGGLALLTGDAGLALDAGLVRLTRDTGLALNAADLGF